MALHLVVIGGEWDGVLIGARVIEGEGFIVFKSPDGGKTGGT